MKTSGPHTILSLVLILIGVHAGHSFAQTFTVGGDQEIGGESPSLDGDIDGTPTTINATSVGTFPTQVDHTFTWAGVTDVNFADSALTFTRSNNTDRGVITFDFGSATITNTVGAVVQDGLSIKTVPRGSSSGSNPDRHKRSDHIAIVNAASLSMGGIDAAADINPGSYAYPHGGDIDIGTAGTPITGNIRVEYLHAYSGDDPTDTSSYASAGAISVYGGWDVTVADSAGTAGDILAYTARGQGGNHIHIEHAGALLCGDIATYINGGGSGKTVGSVTLDGGDSSGDADCGSILTFMRGGNYGSGAAGEIVLKNYNNVEIDEIQGYAEDGSSDNNRACNVTITEGITGNITINGEVNLWAEYVTRDNGTLELTCGGTVTLGGGLDCDTNVIYAALSSGDGTSVIEGVLANFDAGNPQIRCPAGEVVTYDGTESGNAYLALGTYALTNLDATGPGGELKPAGVVIHTWEGDDSSEWTSTSFDDAGGNGATAAGETTVFPAGVSSTTVSIDSSGGNVVAGTLSIAGLDAYTLQKKGAADTLTLSASAGASLLHADNQNHLISANIALNNDLTATMTAEGYGLEISGGISGSGRSILMSGPGTLTLSGANTYDGGTTVSEGVLVAKTSSSALGAGAVTMSGGTLEVRDALTVDTGGITGSAGELHMSGASADLTLNGGGQIDVGTLRYTDNTDAIDARPFAGVAELIADSGAVLTTAGDLTANNVTKLTLTGGTVTVSGTLTVQDLLLQSGTLTHSDITIGGSLTLDGMDLDLGAGNTLTATGADITVGGNATLTVDSTTACDTLTVSQGTIVGAYEAATAYFLANTVVTADLGGAGDLRVDCVTEDGVVDLQGNNTYSGTTYIEDGVLRVTANAGNLAATHLRFLADGTGWPVVLETSGTFARDIGTGAGEIYWDNYNEGGGFSGYGGPLSVTLESGSQLSWNSHETGLGSERLHLCSYSATHAVTLENDINLNDTAYCYVYDNPDTDQDVGILAGKLSGSDDLRLSRGGTLALSNDANDFTGRIIIYSGVLRLTENGGSLGGKRIVFDDPNRYAILESSGTLSMDIGTSAGNVDWEDDGGFAAHGGPLTVTLNGGAQIAWGSGTSGFSSQPLLLGSRTANNVVTVANDLDMGGSDRYIYALDNPHSENDYAIVSGAITGGTDDDLYKWGDGLLVLSNAGSSIDRDLYVQDGTLRISGAFVCDDDAVVDSGATLQGGGTLTANDDIDVNSGGTVAPGDGTAGTLTASCNDFILRGGSAYEFEFGEGAGDRDLIAVGGTGNLHLQSTWTLRVVDLGTPDQVKASDEIDLITYTGSLTDAGSGIGSGDDQVSSVTLDCSALDDGPGVWDYFGAEVRYNADEKRIYLTGLEGGSPAKKATVIILQ